MKKLIFIVGFLLVCFIGYLSFPIAITILKSLFGLAFLVIVLGAFWIGFSSRRKKSS